MNEKETYQEILERVVRIETKIDGYNSLREKVSDSNNRSCENARDIIEIKDSIKWLTRTIAASFITAIIAVVITTAT